MKSVKMLIISYFKRVARCVAQSLYYTRYTYLYLEALTTENNARNHSMSKIWNRISIKYYLHSTIRN